MIIMLLPLRCHYQHPKLPHIGHIPATVRYDPVPPSAIGSIVWVDGVHQARLAVVVALAKGGRWVALVDCEGGFIRCRHTQLHFLGPTPFRTWAARHLRQLGLPVGLEK
jgi:hypothetical protein